MINPEIRNNAAHYREAFVNARPFRHVVMENFFTEDAMAALLREFPAFENKHALNEFGEVGGKAVVTDLKQVSPAYERLYDYVNSPAFLDAMSAVTGIPELLPDPQLYGGGTHENIEGQELDAHVDYNYINGGSLHRRLNLLLYFNKEWEESWGGAIELHANPRRPEEDEIKGFLPLYNRALIFETNEYSWHGFRKIQLPEAKKHLTRKSLAIYLYTRTRPEQEVAPPHSTFYVQRPLPDHIRAGHTLTPETLQEIRILMRRRDDWIEFYQKKELQDSRTIVQLSSQLESLRLKFRGHSAEKELQDSRTIVQLSSQLETLQQKFREPSAAFPEGPAAERPRLTAAYMAYRLYHALPVSIERKMKFKSFIFTHFAPLFRNRQSYKDWKNFKP